MLWILDNSSHLSMMVVRWAQKTKERLEEESRE